MVNAKQIKSQIKSVANIKQITKALEVVATVKLQKIKQQTENYKTFLIEFLKIVQVINNHENIFLKGNNNPKAKELVIVIGTDRGLCGSLNSKLFKHVFGLYESNHKHVEVYCVGKKTLEFFSRANFSVVGHDHMLDTIQEDTFQLLYTYIRKVVEEQSHRSVKLYFNYFHNAIKQTPIELPLFPINKNAFGKFTKELEIDIDEFLSEKLTNKDIILEPTKLGLAKEVREQMIQHMIYGAALLNKTGEFAARMIAMKNAKDNSTTLIKNLQLSFNKARQSAVTQEVSEIMSAKMALED